MSSSDHMPKPKRRVRYSGTHPKKFSEKYKELNPEKYTKDIEKIKSRGTTPVGTHLPICVNEILKILNPKPGEIIVDATLGYGGHASHILPFLENGLYIGVDQDPIERKKTESRLIKMDNPTHKLLIAPINFKDTKAFLKKNDIDKVDMILADLGVSSMQLDDPSRGFSYKVDAPLDLRMNPHIGETASDYLARLNQNQLAQILADYADETHAQQIAKALIKKKPKTTLQLTEAIRSAVSNFSAHIRKQEGDLPIRRAFQALRIAVNEEFTSLEYFLKDIPTILKPGGRVAILSFHSGEDRRVKKSFQNFERLKVYSEMSGDFIRPTFEEQHTNPRSKSAKLRWAIRGQITNI